MKKAWILAALLLVADRLTKWWAEAVLQGLGTLPALPGVFQFTYARNTGAAFSMFTGNNWALALINLLMVALVIALYFKLKGLHPLTRFSLVMIAFGGLGNVIDRAMYGYVVDFIELTFVRFAVFNVADMMVTVGAALAALGLLLPAEGGKGA